MSANRCIIDSLIDSAAVFEELAGDRLIDERVKTMLANLHNATAEMAAELELIHEPAPTVDPDSIRNEP